MLTVIAKRRLMLFGVVILVMVTILAGALTLYFKLPKPLSPLTAQEIATDRSHHSELVATTSAQLVASPSAAAASSSAKVQLTLAQMNQLYGPCVRLPVLMYHHVENLAAAHQEGHAQLTVGTNFFRNQMAYLKSKNYTVIKMADLIDFFDQGKPLPPKPVLLTFDDGYVDFGTDAWPILQEYNYPGTLFTPTGLMENPDYLTWSTISEIASHGLVLMANHTWSHHSMHSALPIIEKEISTAREQLVAHGLDQPQVFAYPYGETSPTAITYLQKAGYQLAFTTKYGTSECKGQRLTLPRIRIGNAPLSNYGL